MPLAALWQEREASTNPVYPFEWTVHYIDGTRFPRVWQGQTRTSRQAPRAGVLALHVTAPGQAPLVVPAPVADPTAIVVEARIVRLAADLRRGAVTGWRFGFKVADRFVGVVLDAAGRVSSVEEPRPARGDARVCPGGLAPAGPAGGSRTRGTAARAEPMT